MPIKDRKKRDRLIQAGTIRLGHKETTKRADGSTYSFPVQDDHFQLHDAPDILASYGPEQGGKVREIDVVLQFTEPSRNFDANYELWAGGVLVCKGDGEYIERADPFTTKKKFDRKGNSKGIGVYNAPGDTLVHNGVAMVNFSWNGFDFSKGDHVTCSGETKDLYSHCANCRMKSILKVAMSRPELVRYAYYKLSTGSGRNYDLINDTLTGLYEAFGHVNGIHYWLRYVERPTTYKDDSGKRHSTKKWFLELEPYPEDLRRLYAEQRARLLNIAQIQPPAAEVVDVDAEYVAEEPAPPPHAEDGAPAESGPEYTDELVKAGEDVQDSPAEQDPSNPQIPTNFVAFVAYVKAHTPYTSQGNITKAIKACGVEGNLHAKGECKFNVADVFSVLAAYSG